jgi:hypothetical protein
MRARAERPDDNRRRLRWGRGMAEGLRLNLHRDRAPMARRQCEVTGAFAPLHVLVVPQLVPLGTPRCVIRGDGV